METTSERPWVRLVLQPGGQFTVIPLSEVHQYLIGFPIGTKLELQIVPKPSSGEIQRPPEPSSSR